VEQNGSFEKRLRRLEDIEEIRALKARYCRFSDRGYDGAGDDPDRVAELFVENGEWQSGGEPARGQEAIRDRFVKFQELLPFAVHIATTPEIVVEEDRATATWYGVIPAVEAGRQAVWIVGRYTEDLVRTETGWRFARMRFDAAFRAPYERGWADVIPPVLSDAARAAPSGASALQIVDPETSPSRPATSRTLLGRARIVPLSAPLGTDEIKINAIYFEPGARFRPHWHPFDQVLFYAYGTGVVAMDGGEDIIVPEGQYVVLPANIPHMHGCTTDGPALQVSMMRDTQTDFENCPVPEAWRSWRE
jgi:quercetin dioxygenase-like cupin family protein